MAHIGTTLEIFDQMTAPLQSITNSLYTTIGAFEDYQDTANSQFDYSNYDGVRSELDSVTKSILQMRNNLSQDLPPIEIPLEIEEPQNNPIQDFIAKWDGRTVEVYTTTGAERAASEMDAFSASIDRVKANQSNLLGSISPEMNAVSQSASQLQDRLEGIASMTAKIPDLDLGIGTQNNMLESVRQNMAQIEQQQNELNQAVQRMDADAANQAYKKLNTTISGTERYLRDNIESQDQFNSEIRAGTSNANDLVRTLGRAAAAYISIQSLGNIISLSDELTQSSARLNLMNDGLQTTVELQNKIFEAAERSRGSYLDMIGTVAALGQRAGDAFSNNNETIAFAENLNKQFIIAGASQEEMNSATLQLTQALGAGVLRGEELNAVFEAAPNVIQSIANYMDVPIGLIKEMASEGQITAEIVKNAMLSATDDINAQLAQMPMTFSQMWTSFKNQALMAFQPVLQRLNDIANSDAFQNLVSSAINGVVFLAAVATEAFNLVASVGQAIAQYWGIIAPIVYGVATAMGLYVGYMIITNTLTAISTGIQTAHAIAIAVKTGVTIAAAAATNQLTIAQWASNSALLASPVTWIVIAIIALIAVLYAAVGAWNHFTGSAVSATGIIAGTFMWLLTGIWNIMILLANVVIGTVEWIVNVFNLGVWAVQVAWIGLLTVILFVIDIIATVVMAVVTTLVNGWRAGILTLQVFWIGLQVLVLAVLDGILNAGISTAEFFTNAWNSAVFGVQNGFYHMQMFISKIMQSVGQGALGIVNSVLGGISSLVNAATSGINKLISMANKIPGINISTIGTVDFKVGAGAQQAIDSIGANITAPTRAEEVTFGRSTLANDRMQQIQMPEVPEFESYSKTSFAKDFLGTMDIPELPELVTLGKFEYADMGNAFGKGYEWGENLADKVKNFSLMDALGFEEPDFLDALKNPTDLEIGDIPTFDELDIPGLEETGGAHDPLGDDISDIADNTADMKDALDLSNEDLQYLRDIAAREAINKHTVAKVDVNIDGIHNNINNEMDLDGVIDYIVMGTEEGIEKAANGVHD